MRVELPEAWLARGAQGEDEGLGGEREGGEGEGEEGGARRGGGRGERGGEREGTDVVGCTDEVHERREELTHHTVAQ